ncbi:hypothetical protein [Streptomyces sp. JV180]|uniref:hypothetical protein n=1 Tax=Streptomyces sp. JV180 TaxID=858634 RepID=UPI00168B203A|nr:hypothetical protein [Streptomyces sp. JV180]MBD3550010.1 hypothetical protein [Streptomyces sp. JV180]
MTETHDTAPAGDSDAEPTEHELRALAASLHITVPPRPTLPLVRRSRYDDLTDDLVTTLTELAKAREDARYWMTRFDAAHDRATEAEVERDALRTAAQDPAPEPHQETAAGPVSCLD